ncbi:MAG: hypothetical protein K2X38_01305 [Gemmataceae bacterium]|nr:hypothetical protein [Gemmataceae bacterium]
MQYISASNLNHMGHKKHRHGPAPIPPANQSHIGPGDAIPPEGAEKPGSSGAAFQEQDPKRRIGNFETAGEHAMQQPGGRNDSHGRPTPGSE